MIALRSSLSLVALIAMITGCGGSQGQTGVAAIPQAAVKPQASANPSTSGPLIYASNDCGGVCILSYPDGRAVGTIALSGNVGGDCSDGAGNVFVANDSQVVEYARGNSNPVATYSLAGDEAAGCSVDRATENLAVVFRGSGADIAVFPSGSETPMYYNAHMLAYYCGYDSSGNLFVDGLNGHDGGLSELPSGASDFSVLSLDGDIGTPGQVQWDGNYITVEGRASGRVYRLDVAGSSATVVGSTRLKGKISNATQSWIYGDRVIVPYASRGRRFNKIGVWKYPKSGKAVSEFQHFGGSKFALLGGVTISAAMTLPVLGAQR